MNFKLNGRIWIDAGKDAFPSYGKMEFLKKHGTSSIIARAIYII